MKEGGPCGRAPRRSRRARPGARSRCRNSATRASPPSARYLRLSTRVRPSLGDGRLCGPTAVRDAQRGGQSAPVARRTACQSSTLVPTRATDFQARRRSCVLGKRTGRCTTTRMRSWTWRKACLGAPPLPHASWATCPPHPAIDLGRCCSCGVRSAQHYVNHTHENPAEPLRVYAATPPRPTAFTSCVCTPATRWSLRRSRTTRRPRNAWARSVTLHGVSSLGKKATLPPTERTHTACTGLRACT